MKVTSRSIGTTLLYILVVSASASVGAPAKDAGTLPTASISTNLKTQTASATNTNAKLTTPEPKPKFTKEQVKKRLKDLKDLLDQGLILQDFYDRKVKECEVTP